MTTISSVVLVDKRIQDYETIVSAVKADGVRAIVFDVGEIDTHCAAAEGSSSSFQYILNEIAALGATSFLNIGVVQHNTGAPFHRFFAMTHGENSTVMGVEAADPTLQTWAGFAAFVTTLKNTYGVQNVDLMACALYSDPNWKYVIDTLAVQTGVTVRASTDDTGAAALGGDWFLESHTGVNLKDVYFTEAIENFSGVLVYSTKYDSSSLFTTKSIAVGKVTAWGAVGNGGGTDINTITGGAITSDVVALYSNLGAFAALKTNGSVSTWGAIGYGGNQTVNGTSSVDSSLNSGVVEIYTDTYSMAALKSDGTVVTWGSSSYGGGISSSVDLTNVVDIYSRSYSFSALKSNGSLVTWGSGLAGNSTTAASNLTSGVVSVNMAAGAAAALKSDGRVVTWPTDVTWGNSSAVASSISSGVVVVYTDNEYTFAALKNDGRVYTWGNTTYTVGNSLYGSTPDTIIDIITINGRGGAYAALTRSGGVFRWGVQSTGGYYGSFANTYYILYSDVVKIYNNGLSFAALRFDGSVFTWGDPLWSASNSGQDSTSVALDLSSGVVAIYGTYAAFAALKSNGKVITWGNPSYGANSSSVATDISAGIVAIYATETSFAALRNDGKLITWGNTSNGGNSSSVSTDVSAGVVSVNNTGSAFAAITSSATTFDLSMSYYRDIDRYNILRNKENRRRVNLTTLNNNVFTLSSARDIQKFNYTIPSGNSFRIIIPDYVSSNYSIISTISIPSPVTSNYIIACEEGEPVTISGVTYINYGAFVYRRNANNTFTKMVTATIGGYTYSLYGGDGIFSSGIALRYRFAIPDKIFGDASFNITAPLTDSSGAFTYTSSNTGVATVTTGGTVTIVAVGTTTITATQAASGSYPSESIPTTLVVNKFVSTLGALTVPAKLASDAPFTLTTPTSTTSSIVSPVNMITSTASLMPIPPDMLDISYGTTWLQRGADIDGENIDYSGYSVAISADGTVVAIGAPNANNPAGTDNTGHVRVYKYTPGKAAVGIQTDLSFGPVGWTRMGRDIDGEAVSNNSGYSVALSADGTVVAIGARYANNAAGTSSTGHVRVYKYNPNKLTEVTDQSSNSFGPVGWDRLGRDIDGEAQNDQSGMSVALSADGTTVAIGALYANNAAGTNDTGHVRVYKYNPNKVTEVTDQSNNSFGPVGWDRLGRDIDGEAQDDYSGYSVALSADGTTVAIGASSANNAAGINNTGHVRVYKYNPNKVTEVIDQSNNSFGPVGWDRLGRDIDGETLGDESGWRVALSADGTTVAIGANYANNSAGINNTGHVRVYKYNPNKMTEVIDQSSNSFGPVGWDRLGRDIDGEAQDDYSGSVALSADGTIVAIGAYYAKPPGGGTGLGHVRVYKYNPNKVTEVTNQSLSNFGPVGWDRLGIDIDGKEGTGYSGYSVALSADGTTVAIGAPFEGNGGDVGRVRIYNISSNSIIYTSSESSIADVYGNLLLIKGVDGTSTMTITQNGNTYTGRLDVSGTTYTLQYNPITYTSSNNLVATVGTYGTVTITGGGTSTITATQAETLNYASRSVTATLNVSRLDSTLGTLTVPAKLAGDEPFTLTAPTSTVSSIISPVYTFTSTASMIPTPPEIRDISYGTTWSQLGLDISGNQTNEKSGWSVSVSADGTVVAIGSNGYDKAGGTTDTNTQEGRTRIYKYNGTSWIQLGLDISGIQFAEESGWSVSLSADGTTVAIGFYKYDNAGGTGNSNTQEGRTRIYKYNGTSWIQLGLDISGNQVSEFSGYSVSLSADGTTVAIGSYAYDIAANGNEGRTRIYKYNGTSWIQMGLDISGNQASENSGYSVSLSADGTTVAIGSIFYDINTSTNDNVGRTRIYKYNGTSWNPLGADILGNQVSERSGASVSLSADGTTVAIGFYLYDIAANGDEGRTRIYKYNGTSWIQLGLDISGNQAGENSGWSVSLSADGNTVAIGSYNYDVTAANFDAGRTRIYKYNGTSWIQLGLDISGNQAGEQSGRSLSLSADGTTVAIGSNGYNIAGNGVVGRVRIYRIATTNALTYTSSSSSIADVCGNLLLIKGVNGTSTITASQSGNTITGRLDVSGTTYTLQYNPITYTISDASLATVSTYGTVTLTGTAVGTSTITATQPETRNYASKSVTATLDVSGIVTVLGALTIPTKMFGDASFNLTAPSTNNPSGAFTYTSSNTAVATVTSGGLVSFVGTGTTTITATQAASGLYTSASVSGSLVVNFGNTSSITRLQTDGPYVIPTPVSNIATTYGSIWNQLGADTVGKVSGDESGTSISVSADGTIVAIGARSNTTNRGTVRVYKYNDVSWNQIGSDINGEASSDYSGQSVSLSANGRVVAIGANMNDGSGNLLADSGHVRIYEFNGTTWVQRGGDIDGEAAADQSGISVSLSADGSTVAIGAIMNDGSGNALSNSGHVRVYKYNASKSVPQLTDQSAATFGPAGWDRLGADIDGEAVNDQSGFSVSISVDGTIVAIGAIFNDGTSGTVDTSNNRGHVRVYRYNASKTSPQLTNQSLTTFGPAGWDRMGSDIDGEVAADQSGFSVSLSADGSAVAIGSPLYDVSGVTNAGRVRVFAWNGSSWAQRGQNINGVNLNENVGDSVSLSANGSILSVSSFMKVVNYNYNSSTNTWSQMSANVTGASTKALYSPHVYLDATNPTSYNRTTNTWTNIGSVGGNVVMTNMVGTFDASDNGGSFNFNGSSNYGQLSVPSTTLTSITYLAVVKTTLNTNRYATIIEFGLDTLLFSTLNNVLLVYQRTSSGFSLAADVWYVLAVTITSGGSITYYVNGVSVFTGTGTAFSTTNTLYGIGGGVSGGENWNGKISALAVYHNRVLTASEIANVSNTFQTYRVSLSSQGNIVAVGAREYDGTTGTSTNIGVARVYRIDTSGNYTFSSNNTAIADVCGNIILPKSAGSTTIAFTQSASGETASRSGTIAFSVSGITPTFGAFTIPAKNFGDAAFSLTAPTSDSSGAFTYDSSNIAVATVTSGGMVTIVGVGSTTITATQAESGNYAAGSVTASLMVSAIEPTIGELSVPAKNFGDAAFDLTAPSSNSGGAFTYESSNTAVATVTSGGIVTVVAVGTTTITVTQAASANGNYTGGSSVTGSLVVSAIAPTYQSITQITKTYSTDVSFSLLDVMTGISNSNGAYTFSSESDAVDICGGVATILAYTPSAITITASQEASGNYASSSKTFTLLVNRKTPSYGAFSVPAATYEDAPFSIAPYAPTTDSTLVPFTYTSSDPNVATISTDGTVVTIIGQGYTTITASQDASGNYAASSTTTSFLVNRAAPTFLKAFTIPNKTFGDASFSLLPFTDGLDNTDGTYHFTSSNAQLVSISEADGVTATIHAYTPTPITIYVAIDACGNYAASSTSGTLTVLRATPTFGAFTVPVKNFRDASFNLTAPTSDSSGAFTYTSSNTSVATVTSSGGVTIIGAGNTTITATQEINGNYTTRDISAALVVSPIAPSIGALTAPAKNFGDVSFNLTEPTSDSSGAFTYTSSNTAVATVTSDGTVTIIGVGSTTITATQAGSADGNYTTGSVGASLVVSASLRNFSVPAKTYGDASFNLVDPDTTDNTVGFTFASSNTAVATLSGVEGRTVTITGAGSTVITATQAATATRGQLDISATLVVSKVRPVITIAPITKAYGNPSFRPVPTTTNTDTSGGSVFTFTSNNIAVVSMLDTSLVRINGVGTATLSITQAASANFTDASSSVVLTVNKGVSGLSASTFAVATNKTFGDAAFAITTIPISSSTGAITYSSSDEAVATVRSDGSGNSAITVVGQGTVTFTASQAESALYTADTKTSNTLTVARKTVALSRDTPSADTISKSYGDATFTVTATNESNGAFSFASSDPSFATIDASTGEVSIVAVGSTTLTATRAQTAQYNIASVSWTLNIARGTTALTGLSSLSRNVTVAPFSVSASSESDGAVSYALQDQSSTVLTIHPTSGLITLLSPGSAVIVASQAQGTLYEAPASITATITVSEAGNTLEGSTLTGSNNYANVDLSGGSLANSNITNTNFSSGRLDNSNFSGATISGANMSSCELSNASFNNSTVNNTNFTSGRLNNANMNGASITNSNMTSADLSDATMRGSTITGTDFTSAILRRTDLSGANVRGSIFNNADLSGAILARLDASGASFINANLAGANLSNADFTNANMTNANISGADITNVTFTVGQKLQLLKNRANRSRSEIQVSQVLGSVLLPILSAGSAVRDVPNVANATFKVMLPTTSLVSSDTILDIILDISNFAYFYFPIGENEYFQIQGVKYYISGSTVRNFATGVSVENTSYGVKAIRLLAGSLTIIVNSQNTLSSSSFVVPSYKINTDAPFSPTTLPTSNSSAPIVYSSSNTSIATINSSSGVITPVSGASGYVRFTASQSATETHESASITSNELFVNRLIDFTLPGLNQTFTLSTMASLDASSINVESTDATAVFYVRLSDMTNLFQYQTDSFDVNNTDASDVKYYVFHRTMPTELHFNPSHAMMNKTESAGMLGGGVQEISADKSLVKHDFIRYIALRLFNTYHGVDLFQNENDLQENITYLGETVNHNIDTILSGISTTSASETMPYDASGNKYLTNDASGNMNLCRELMRQVAAAEPSRFYNNGADTAASGVRNVPLQVDDSINFKLTITAAPEQNIATGVTVIPSRTYLIKMVLKNTVNTSTNDTNTSPTDSEMYPNSYPYSTSVTTYAPTAESSSSVYNVYSPPAPIPTSRFGYNGWYYANTSAWVNIEPAVRDRVKWLLPSNAAGSSTVADLRYIRMNLKVYNKTSLPFIVVTTQAGSYRKYTISASNSLTNGIVYSFYMNFNSYVREPATIGATNAALTYSGVSNGSFDNSEVIASIAVETDSAAATSSVEFTLSRVIVGEVSGEKAYGFSSNV